MANPKSSTKSANSKVRKKKSFNFRQIFLVGFMLLAMIAFIFSSLPAGLFRSNSSSSSSSTEPSEGTTATTNTIAFKKEGELTFSNSNGDIIRQIDIEIAEQEAERNMGLMYRRSMPDHSGMLFIMDNNENQSFWMKNTYISLDILYINEQKEIVSITEGTTPLSEAPIPSNGKARYVLEVVAGYCKANNIVLGDRVSW